MTAVTRLSFSDPTIDPTCHNAAIQNDDDTDLTGDITIQGIVVGVIEDSTLFLLG